MTGSRWEQVKGILEGALARAPAERMVFVREQCGGDATLVADVEALLAAHERAGSFAERPPLSAGARLGEAGGHRIEALYHAALARAEDERMAFLAEACAGDEPLRHVVESLLAGEHGASGVLSGPLLAEGPARMAMAREAPGSLVGRQAGSFQVVGRLGAGGMGEVYRARDLKLGREVAIKILPAAFTSDPDRLARFAREARVLAALNHPHIAAIHGLEKIDGGQALVLELVEGPTLADRLAKGPLPVKEALAAARQIAEALEAAHEKGIVHRDLKPANIKLTAAGVVKVLDFGLAKVGPGAGDPGGGEASQLPTLTVGGTREGMVVGTAAYMSPEQARGQPVDKRTDIWAFGCVLYEMLTGRGAFAGATLSDTLVAVLEREPDWTALPAATPAAVRRLLQRCLEKDRQRRVRDIGDARLEIEEAVAAPASPSTDRREGVAAASAVPRRRTRILGLIAAAASVLLVGAGAVRYLGGSGDSIGNPLEGATFARLTEFAGAEHHAAISRDGRFVVFLSDRDGTWDGWVSQVGTGEIHNLTKGSVPELRNPGTRTIGFSPDGSLVVLWVRRQTADGSVVDAGWAVPTLGGAIRPYLPGISELEWSPDGRRVVYHTPADGDPMFVTDAGEKSGREIYKTQAGIHNHFPVWSPDAAFIYFVHGLPLEETDIWRIRPTGGAPERITFHNSRVTFPTFLDARTLLYLATADDGSGPWIHALDVENRVSRRVSTGVEEYLSLAASADGRRLVATVSGAVAGLWRVPITDRVADESAAAPVALPTPRGLSPRIHGDAVLYRAPRTGTDGLWRLVGGAGTEVWSGVDGRAIAGSAVAPDGKRLAFPVLRQGVTQLYIANADGTAAHRVAESLDVRGSPAWSPDGQWIAIAANQDGQQARLFKIPVDGGAPTRLTDEYAIDPVWSPDGTFLVYTNADVGTTFQVKAVTADGKPRDLPSLTLSRGSRRMAFLPGGSELVVLKGDISNKDFWAVDLGTGRDRQLTDLGRGFVVADFDISPDGREIVFDRARDESDIVLIDLAAR